MYLVEISSISSVRQGLGKVRQNLLNFFALILQATLEAMIEKKWGVFPKPIPDLEVQLLMYQDDIFLWEEDAERLQRKISLINDSLRDLGLQLASKKTAIASTQDYKGKRSIVVQGDVVPVMSADEPIRVLGLNFTFDGDQSRQARETHGQTQSSLPTKPRASSRASSMAE